ncbi:hypothetical protein DPMN_002159 [Dreissena polymorpha]|uniref:Uncharacterized protein n=1 Tax=Dreissena polymorpha TaxID=45954 RepID=A0A9D4ML42_DREPO|nr:hypothetical protein DPMN_002159 [Dreissena polymorpha]
MGAKIVRGHVTEEEYNTAMNTLFVKLHMLDPQSVIPTFHLLNHIRALPECNLELATRDYLGGMQPRAGHPGLPRRNAT